ncbi:MAG: lysozyme inhibitor LprI family protein [Pseudorhodoplanes sp.]|uniref:lysozyme inhibitor LprI family protein n=1 Tax=Pseudorhodoplanes sp. TaxID=1934341 RepID=UPI003D1477DF
MSHPILRLAFAACVALATTATLPALGAGYSPLNCAAARSPTEMAICGNYRLGQLEARMATLYEWSTGFVGMGQRGDLQDAQRAFIRQRESCGSDVGCLTRVYDARIAELQAVMERVRERGPF